MGFLVTDYSNPICDDSKNAYTNVLQCLIVLAIASFVVFRVHG